MTFAAFITIALQRGTDYSPPCGPAPDKLKTFKTLAAEIPKARDAVGGFTAKITYEVMDPYSDLPDTREGTLTGRKDDLIVDLKTLRVRHTATTLTIIDVDKKTYRELAVDAARPETWTPWSWLMLAPGPEAAKAYAITVLEDGRPGIRSKPCLHYWPSGPLCECKPPPEPPRRILLLLTATTPVELEIDPALGLTTVVRVGKKGEPTILRVTDLKKEPVKPDPFKAFDELKAQCKKETP